MTVLRTILSMFSGAGGLDLGFESAGFSTITAIDIDNYCIATMKKNRPQWNPIQADAREWTPTGLIDPPDILLAGPPCQGFSLGGNRQAADDRNGLFHEVCRIAAAIHPRVVVIENVLNLRTMVHQTTGKPFIDEIAHALTNAGYSHVAWDVFRMDGYGVPQTRRRFVFIAFRDGAPEGWHLPVPYGYEPIRSWLWDLAHDKNTHLPNHDPDWGFDSQVHVDRGIDLGPHTPTTVVRFSRTASDGYPIRDWNRSFPAVDTATVWGFARGRIAARRDVKPRGPTAKFVRNPNADTLLWRIEADRLRSFTHREYARLQTFPDNWEFIGKSKRDIHLQIGNAVPVRFAERLARNLAAALDANDSGRPFRTLEDSHHMGGQIGLF